MSDGGEETVKESKNNEPKKKANDFVQFLARVAIAQICESIGFQGFQQSALDTLSDVAIRYIREIGKSATLSAYSAGRRECNVFDVIRGLEDLGSVQGFSGGSDVRHCLLGSGTVREIVRYVGEAEEIPFPYGVPKFPVVKERKLNPSFVQSGENTPGEHIPAWLPVFPDPETYADKQSGNEKEGNIKVERTEQVDEQRKPEKPLLSFQHRLANNGSEAVFAVEPDDAVRAKRAVESNRFLVQPLQFGEKEVSLVLRPSKLSEEHLARDQNHHGEGNHVSVMEAFAPDIGPVKSKLSDTEEGRQKVLFDRRPSIQFKLGSRRKFAHTAMEIQSEGFEKITSWFSTNSRKDEKKRRAEEILKQSMENRDELDHL